MDGPTVSSDYWDQLGDSTLSRLVGEVARGNLDVRSAQARVSAARSDRVRSALDLTPSGIFNQAFRFNEFTPLGTSKDVPPDSQQSVAIRNKTPQTFAHDIDFDAHDFY